MVDQIVVNSVACKIFFRNWKQKKTFWINRIIDDWTNTIDILNWFRQSSKLWTLWKRFTKLIRYSRLGVLCLINDLKVIDIGRSDDETFTVIEFLTVCVDKESPKGWPEVVVNNLKKLQNPAMKIPSTILVSFFFFTEHTSSSHTLRQHSQREDWLG